MSLDTEHTSHITCPYCGYEDRDSWEWNEGEEGDGEHECASCGETMTVSRHVHVTYSTSKKEGGG